MPPAPAGDALKVVSSLPVALPCSSIFHLPAALTSALHGRDPTFTRSAQSLRAVFDINANAAIQRIPEGFKARALSIFAALVGTEKEKIALLEHQTIVTVANVHTDELSAFNDVRRLRVAERTYSEEEERKFRELYTASTGAQQCDFCSVDRTSEDAFGRLKGPLAYTASNVGKLAPWHTLIISYHHDPLGFNESLINEMICHARDWCQKVNKIDRSFSHCNIISDIGKRASASQDHFHMQVFMQRGRHAAGFQRMFHAAERAYMHSSGKFDYWTSLIHAHAAAGLHISIGDAHVMPYLSPILNKEIMVVAPGPTDSFGKAVALAMMALRDKGQSRAMSLGIAFTVTPTSETGQTIPYTQAVFRVSDRGNPFDVRSDIGALEFYASPYIATDPYRVMEWLKATVN